MIHQPPTPPTMTDAVTFIETYGTSSQKQDIRKSRPIFALHGVEGPDFESFPADLAIFEERIPKLSGPKPALQRLVQTAGISQDTYRQGWRAGRRLIDAVTGATADKVARKTRDDAWAKLLCRLHILSDTGLIDKRVHASLAFLIDLCRTNGISPHTLDTEQVAALDQRATRHEWKKLRKGLKALDQLRDIPRLADFLPHSPLTLPAKPHGTFEQLPEHLQAQIESWIERAAREQVGDPRYEQHAETLSDGTRASYRAAFGLYLKTLGNAGCDLSTEIALSELFDDDQVDMVIGAWSISAEHSARTYYGYTSTLALVLGRNGYPDAAAYLSSLLKLVPCLQQGRAANKMMSPKAKRWCQALLSDPKKTTLFQIQHVEYYRLCLKALTEAQGLGLNLKSVSDPKVMAALPATTRWMAKKILRRVRMLGLLAAYTAIALEGAPYRRGNMLSMRHTGPHKTFFDHLIGSDPYVTIKFPNEELKNGKWLTERGEELEAVTIKKRDSGDYGTDILHWYLQEIRPLFPAAEHTHCFFPPLEAAATSETGFNKGTFYVWLSEGSAEIGLPMTSHNFRHGFCSIDINEGHRSIEDLSKILGDTVNVIRRNYAWIDTQQSVINVQQDTARRRARIMAQRRRK